MKRNRAIKWWVDGSGSEDESAGKEGQNSSSSSSSGNEDLSAILVKRSLERLARKDASPEKPESSKKQEEEEKRVEAEPSVTHPPPLPEPNWELELEKFVAEFDVDENGSTLNQMLKRLELRLHWPYTAAAIFGYHSLDGLPKDLRIHGIFIYPSQSKKKKASPPPLEDAIDIVKSSPDTVKGQRKFRKEYMLMKLLEVYWPSYVPTRPGRKFLKYEWSKHGKYTGLTQYQYFGIGLFYFYKLRTGLKFKTNVEYTIWKFITKLKKHANRRLHGHVPRLRCKASHDIPLSDVQTPLVFHEISICVARKDNVMVLTGSSDNGEWRKKNGYYTKKKMIVPYPEY